MINPLLTLFAVGTPCPERGFFGLKPWFHYINDTDHFQKCDIKVFTVFPSQSHASDVPLVLLAIIDDLLRIAGLVAVGFVIVGAIKFITSQGQPEDTANAQSTVINALIGLVVAIVAVAFVTFLGNKLGG